MIVNRFYDSLRGVSCALELVVGHCRPYTALLAPEAVCGGKEVSYRQCLEALNFAKPCRSKRSIVVLSKAVGVTVAQGIFGIASKNEEENYIMRR